MRHSNQYSWADTILALSPFFWLNVAIIAYELNHHLDIPHWVISIANNVASIVLSFSFLILIVGWKKLFPRWSYPYVAYAIIFSLLFSIEQPIQFGFFGLLPIKGEMWKWTAWIPLFGSAFIAFWINPTVNPLKRYFVNALEDWTIISFTLFSFTPFFFGAGIERYNQYPFHATELIRDIVIFLVTMISVLFYMRANSRIRQVFSLHVGVIIVVLIAVLDETIYFQENNMVDLKGAISHAIIYLSFYIIPPIIGIAYKSIK